jgi:site-specific recombinase XerD
MPDEQRRRGSPAPSLTLRRRITKDSSVSEALEAWLVHLGAAKPAAATLAGYRRDLQGVAGRLAVLEGVVIAGPDGFPPAEATQELRIIGLERQALIAAFASWASDHAAASVRRAHSAWSSFFDYLVAEGVIDGNPMAAVPKPKTPSSLPRSIKAPDAIGRLLRAASEADPRARDPWPSRDLALVATFCVTGIREAEAAGLSMGALAGEPGNRRMEVKGKGGKVRPVPIDAALDAVLSRYATERKARFPKEDTDHPSSPLFVDVRGRRMTVDQIRYLVEKLYIRAGIRAQVPAGALVHALRHTFATSALEAGADVVELQELLGHASLETTRRYLSATAQGLRQVIAGHPSQAALRELGSAS